MKQSTSFSDVTPDKDAGDQDRLAADQTVKQAGSLEVPVLAGLEPQAAVAQLRELGLVPAVESEEVAEPERVGLVFAQRPLPGSEASRGDVVEMRIGTAPEPEVKEPELSEPAEDDGWFDLAAGDADEAALPPGELDPKETLAASGEVEERSAASAAPRRVRRKRRPAVPQHAHSEGVVSSPSANVDETRRRRLWGRALGVGAPVVVAFAIGALLAGSGRTPRPSVGREVASPSKHRHDAPTSSPAGHAGVVQPHVGRDVDVDAGADGRPRQSRPNRSTRRSAPVPTAVSRPSTSPAAACEWCVEQPSTP